MQGAKLVRRNAAGVDVVRHRTAIIRRDLSRPVQILIGHGIIFTNSTVLDDGCGQGDDVTALTADVINLGLVLNVIEDRHERAETLAAAYGFAQRALSIAVMPLGKYTFDGLRPYGDGYVTTRGTFQQYFGQQDLRNFIADTLGEAPVAFAPGIFVVFRDKVLEQEVLLKHQSRDIIRPLGWQAPERRRQGIAARPALIERIRAELDMLWTAMADRGRILNIEEFPDTLRERLRIANVSPARATDLCLSDAANRENLAISAVTRREALLIHLALTLFPGAPRYMALAKSIQKDVRNFFGSHAAAIQEANALLFSVGKTEIVHEAIAAAVAAGLGAMRDSGTYRLYAPALNRLPAVLRVLVGCAGVLRGGTQGADFIDIKLDGRRVTFIACVDATARLPIYSERTRVDLGRLKVSTDQPEGMIIYQKGRFLPADAPGVAEQLAFDRKLVGAGIADEEGKGPRLADLQELLRQRRMRSRQTG